MVRHAAAVVVLLVLSAPALHAQATPAAQEDLVFTVTAETATVYATPSTGGVALGKAPRGRAYLVTRELGSWVKISWPGARDGVGYLHGTWGRVSRGGVVDVSPVEWTRPTSLRPAAGEGAATPPPSAAQPPLSRPLPPRGQVLVPSHMLGIGGRMGSEAFGFAATGRVWARSNVGVQMELGRSIHTAAGVPQRLTTTHFAPSVVYSPRDLVTNAVWVRPYIGAGADFYRSKLGLPVPDATFVTDSGRGYHAFGGAEFTWANVPNVAVSADLRRQWMPESFAGFQVGDLGFSMSVHWYVW